MVVAGGLAGCSTIGHAKAFAPDLFGMEAVTPNLHVDADMTPEARLNLIASVTEAEARVAAVYGSVQSKPDIVACSTRKCFESFGGGRQRALAIGGTILLAPRGNTTSMIAHEWSHTELHARLGWIALWITGDLPAWFDEGLAVAVSGDPLHSEEVWRVVEQSQSPRPLLTNLVTLSDWNRAVVTYGDVAASMAAENETGTPAPPMVVYPMVGHVVRGWLKDAGQAGLLALIAQVREGGAFGPAYRGLSG
jgi:hypothetical protein